MMDAIGDWLTTQDTMFRPGIRGDERIFMALVLLANSTHFRTASLVCEHSMSTVWDSFYMFLNACMEKIVPLLVRFPTGELAL